MVAHPVILRGLATLAADGPPVVVQRSDADFLPAILAELGGDPGLRDLLRQTPRLDERGAWSFGQPVHQMFQVALFEVCCDRPGLPRLDPTQIESAGLVVRRVESGAARHYRWLRRGKSVCGWRAISSAGESQEDPEAERRPDPLRALPAEQRRFLGASSVALNVPSEQVTPLYVAPAAVCRAAGRTILYGLVPVTSTERAEADPRSGDAGYDLAFVREHLVGYLRASSVGSRPAVRQRIPRPGAVVDRSATSQAEFAEWVMLLRQLGIELGVFDETLPDSAPARRLLGLLNTLRVCFAATEQTLARQVPLGDALAAAARVFVQQVEGESVQMPDAWPTIDSTLADELATTARLALNARLQTLQPEQGRYEDRSAQYCLRGFVRIACREGCPSRIYWSSNSQLFSILPWYEMGNRPMPRIELPPIDRQIIRKLKPNVTFVVPGKLFDFMQSNDPLAILRGEATEGSGLGIRWICGFNIPIITLCAFILLYVILVLLNIVFWWLPFVRVCLPLPEKKG